MLLGRFGLDCDTHTTASRQSLFAAAAAVFFVVVAEIVPYGTVGYTCELKL